MEGESWMELLELFQEMVEKQDEVISRMGRIIVRMTQDLQLMKNDMEFSDPKLDQEIAIMEEARKEYDSYTKP